MRKKISQTYLILSTFLLSYLLMFPTNVYATTTSNAVSDIMNSDRFAGAISSIEWLTTRVDYWFTMAVTATGFFIISSALLKNACAGAYCANHKFWDKVAEAHEKNESIQLSQLFSGIKDKFMNISTTGVKDAILCLVPNIKAFTDFDDADIEPKQYFMKAIPQMLGCIIIGVFIYNGYYRDTAATVGNFGSEICTRVFSSVDPAAWVDKLTQTTGTPACIYENDDSLEGECLLQISKELYKSYLSVAKNITSSDAKTSLMRDCENTAANLYKSLKSTKNSSTGKTFGDIVFDGETRQYDFSISNLKIVLCPTNAGTMGELKIGTVDKDTNSEFAITGFYKFDSKYKTQVPSDKQAFHIAFNMKGSQKTSKTGLTAIIAQAGAGASDSLTQIDATVNVTVTQSRTTSGAWDFTYNGDMAGKIYAQIKDQVVKNVTSYLKKTDSNISNVRVTGFTAKTWRNSANSSSSMYKNTATTQVTTDPMVFTVYYTYMDSSGNSSGTLNVLQPVNVTLQ